jgi:hypothetical protein
MGTKVTTYLGVDGAEPVRRALSLVGGLADAIAPGLTPDLRERLDRPDPMRRQAHCWWRAGGLPCPAGKWAIIRMRNSAF